MTMAGAVWQRPEDLAPPARAVAAGALETTPTRISAAVEEQHVYFFAMTAITAITASFAGCVPVCARVIWFGSMCPLAGPALGVAATARERKTVTT